MLVVLHQCRASALIFSPKVPPADCAATLGIHHRRIREAIARHSPVVLYVSRSSVEAHDFAGGPRQRVLGNGTIRGFAKSLPRAGASGEASEQAPAEADVDAEVEVVDPS